MKSKNFLIPSILLTGASITVSQAAVSYIDATATNTKLRTDAGDLQLELGINYKTTGSTDGGLTSDGFWNLRSGIDQNSGDIFNSQGGTNTATTEGGVDGPDLDFLVTTFTLPQAGQYNIYGYFWVGGNGTHDWDAGFELGNSTGATAGNTLYTNANATNIATLSEASTYFTENSIVYGASESQDMFEASLGIWNTAIDGFTVTVIVDGSQISVDGEDNRTWYDGVGYQSVPEPATYALLGGLLALSSVALRRRKG